MKTLYWENKLDEKHCKLSNFQKETMTWISGGNTSCRVVFGTIGYNIAKNKGLCIAMYTIESHLYRDLNEAKEEVNNFYLNLGYKILPDELSVFL